MNSNSENQLELMDRELRIRGLSPRIRKVYLYYLTRYFNYKKRDLNIADIENIKNFLVKCEEEGVSAQVRNLMLNAIKFYYSVIKTQNKIEIRSVKEYTKLPIILLRGEIKK